MLKRILPLSALIVALAAAAAAQNVTVQPGNGSYATLAEAFNAINAGTHTGSVTVMIAGDTTETATATLNASGTGSANYTSVTISPSGGPRTISGSFTGALIRLAGADNVTIDGRIAGSGNNLTVSNASTATGSAVIWISSLGAGAGATNNTIRNLNIAAGVTNANTLSTFGVIMSGTTISATSNGADNDNNKIIFNNLIRGRYGIVTRGEGASNLNQGTVIEDNTVGPASGFGPDQIGKVGIFAQFENGCNINRNLVRHVGGTFATTTGGADRVGIALGSESWATTTTNLTMTGCTVARNIVRNVVEERTFSAVGIIMATTNAGNATDHLVANNMIFNVRANGTVTDTGVGIGIGGGNGDRVVFNSISMTGDIDPEGTVTATQSQVGVRIASAVNVNNLIFRNNIVYVDVTSNNEDLRHYIMIAPSATFAWGTGGADRNVYFTNPVNPQMAFGGIGTTTPFTVVQNLSEWRAVFDPDQDLNSRFGNPAFVSPTADLHIQTGVPSAAADLGVPVAGVTDDIDGQTRDAVTPDAGADEGAFTQLPANDIAAAGIVSPAPGSVVPTGSGVAPRAAFFNAGTSTQTNVQVGLAIAGPSGYQYINSQTIASIGPSETVVVTFAATPVIAAQGTYTISATVLTPDSNSANNTLNSTFEARTPLAGSFTVGTGGTFASLTNPGGLFEYLNIVGVAGDVVIYITEDLTAESGTIALDDFAGEGTVTIKPFGAARRVSSASNTPLALIRLNGTDNLVIDGSLAGGSDRSLTFEHGNTGGTVFWFASAGAGNGVDNVTIKNTIITGKPGSPAVSGVLSGSGATLGNEGEAPHNNNALINNWIYRVQNSVYIRGNTASRDQNWTITGNTFSSNTAADKNSFRGMLIGNADNFVIADNVVESVQSTATTTAAMNGMQLAFNVSGGLVSRNTIKDVKNVSATGTGAFGITISAASTNSNTTIANNFIMDIAGTGSGTNQANGFQVAAGSGWKIYFNSVNMNTNQAAGTTAAFNVTTGVTAAGALDVRNNIFANTQTSGATRFAIANAGAANLFGTINYNDYFSTQNVGTLGGTVRATLADWQAATGQDANSKAVDPLFVSATDLHLQAGSPLLGMGVEIPGINIDIDEQTRGVPPDIGADEVGTAASLVTVAGRILTADGRGITKVSVTVSGGSLAQPVTVLTGSFGYFTFPNLPAGETYLVQVRAKRFAFAEPSRYVTPKTSIADLDFTAEP